jgi:hypothetical protein
MRANAPIGVRVLSDPITAAVAGWDSAGRVFSVGLESDPNRG